MLTEFQLSDDFTNRQPLDLWRLSNGLLQMGENASISREVYDLKTAILDLTSAPPARISHVSDRNVELYRYVLQSQNSVSQIFVRRNTLHRWFDRDILEVRFQESSKSPWEIEADQITPWARNTLRQRFPILEKGQIYY